MGMLGSLILCGVVILVMPILLALIFERIDSDAGIKMQRTDILRFIAVSIVAVLTISISHDNTFVSLNKAIIIGYLSFVGYTDSKISMIYTSVSLVMVILEVMCLVRGMFFIEGFEIYASNVAVPLGLFVLSMVGGIGLGDVLVYTVLCVYYMQYMEFSTIYIILNILIASISFVAASLFSKIFSNKNKCSIKSKKPMGMHILISTIIICAL